jgi:hypothetical protein
MIHNGIEAILRLVIARVVVILIYRRERIGHLHILFKLLFEILFQKGCVLIELLAIGLPL